MKICFVLSAYPRHISGGYKVVFEYANAFCDRGHTVSVLFMNTDALKGLPIPSILKKIGFDLLTLRGPKWSQLNKQIKLLSGYKRDLTEVFSKMDAVIATEVRTAEFVYKLNSKAKKAYFIQDYETWIKPEEYIRKTYQLGMNNIVISSWLEKIVNEYSVKPCTVIRNPLDTDCYKCKTPIDGRLLHSIAFLYHQDEHKGTKYAIEAIRKLKERFSDLRVYAFGTTNRNSDLPSYVEYTQRASKKQTIEIYNKVTVFLCATVNEGFGLTGLEAMACGAVLVSTDYDAVHEYAINGVNSLLSPVKDVEAMVFNVTRVFRDSSLRTAISRGGIETVRQGFSMKNAVVKFEEVIKKD